jgi:hypothetical protein
MNEMMGLTTMETEKKPKKTKNQYHDIVVPVKLAPRNEESIQDWVSKAREVLKESNENRRAKKAIREKAKQKFLIPRYFASYRRLHKRDLVITIEHCHSCCEHDSNTRHVASKYTTMADYTLKMIAEICHEMCLSVRVGVFRFKARIVLAPGEVDSDSRIGAFEVQAAYRDSYDEIHYEILHSKLATTYWPSRSALVRKMEAFVEKADMHKHIRSRSAQWMDHGDDGLKIYPVGVGPWSGSKLAVGTALGDDPSWEFPVKLLRRRLVEEDDDDGADMGSSRSPRKQRLYNVNWVYDSREMIQGVEYSVGQMVRILGLETPTGTRERHVLCGIVKAVLPQPDEPAKLTVRLKYHNDEIIVSVQQCAPFENSDVVKRDPDTLPSELEGLILIANRFQDSGLAVYEPRVGEDGHLANKWMTPSADDKGEGNHIFLTKSTFFHQMRRLAAVVEQKLHERGLMLTHSDAKNPSSNKGVDLQKSYSEEVINWVFSRYGRLADMFAIESFAIDNFEGVSGTKLRRQSVKTIPKPSNPIPDPGEAVKVSGRGKEVVSADSPVLLIKTSPRSSKPPSPGKSSPKTSARSSKPPSPGKSSPGKDGVSLESKGPQ